MLKRTKPSSLSARGRFYFYEHVVSVNANSPVSGRATQCTLLFLGSDPGRVTEPDSTQHAVLYCGETPDQPPFLLPSSVAGCTPRWLAGPPAATCSKAAVPRELGQGAPQQDIRAPDRRRNISQLVRPGLGEQRCSLSTGHWTWVSTGIFVTEKSDQHSARAWKDLHIHPTPGVQAHGHVWRMRRESGIHPS